MNRETHRIAPRAFTLIELLVVMAIIALLVSILIPTIASVRSKARVTQAKSQFNSLDAGLQAFTTDTGGKLPPSASDDPDNPHMISDPLNPTTITEPDTRIAGAHLLLHAMVGADLNGPPGFVDLNRNGRWSDDTHAGPRGAYELDVTTAEPKRTRYGGTAGYVSDTMRSSITTIQKLIDGGRIQSWTGNTPQTADQFLFVDPWDQPILYYRANKAARFMTSPGPNGEPGVYRQEDNGVITGTEGGTFESTGVDFGAGPDEHGQSHFIHKVVTAPLPAEKDANGVNTILTQDDTYAHSLTRLILDPNSVGKNRPVRADTFLLISAGEDGIYGTKDDVLNWQRNAN